MNQIREREVFPLAPDVVEDTLLSLWNVRILFQRSAPPTELRSPDIRSRTQKTWFVVMTEEFKKTIKGIDRKLQGRILEALMKISSDPLQPVGDTVKPLTGDAKGLWRYRLGDFRLVYKPDSDNDIVFLLSFSSRGSAYEYEP